MKKHKHRPVTEKHWPYASERATENKQQQQQQKQQQQQNFYQPSRNEDTVGSASRAVTATAALTKELKRQKLKQPTTSTCCGRPTQTLRLASGCALVLLYAHAGDAH